VDDCCSNNAKRRLGDGGELRAILHLFSYLYVKEGTEERRIDKREGKK